MILKIFCIAFLRRISTTPRDHEVILSNICEGLRILLLLYINCGLRVGYQIILYRS